MGTERLRAVFDTNVFVSAFLSRNPTSPTQELIRRWEGGEFVLLVSDALLEEVAGKLVERGIEQERVIEFLTLVGRLAEWVDVPPEAVRPVIADDPTMTTFWPVRWWARRTGWSVMTRTSILWERTTRGSRSPKHYPSCGP